MGASRGGMQMVFWNAFRTQGRAAGGGLEDEGHWSSYAWGLTGGRTDFSALASKKSSMDVM
jgi:hypothetical protein